MPKVRDDSVKCYNCHALIDANNPLHKTGYCARCEPTTVNAKISSLRGLSKSTIKKSEVVKKELPEPHAQVIQQIRLWLNQQRYWRDQ